MGIRSSLVKSLTILTMFWWFVCTAVFYFLPENKIFHMAENLVHLEIELPKVYSALNELKVQNRIAAKWIPSVLFIWVISVAICIILAALLVGSRALRRKWRFKGRGNWRGVTITQDLTPRPPQKNIFPAKVNFGKIKYSKELQRFTNAVFGLLHTHRNAYAGDGHGVNLYTHTQNVVNAALNKTDADHLLAICASAHDIGKITSFKKSNNGWVSIKPHDKESAKIIAEMPQWWLLPEPERSLILMAVKHYHAPHHLPLNLPNFNNEQHERLKLLVAQLREIDGVATNTEKKAVLKNLPLTEMAFRSFLDAIPSLTFQIPRLPKGQVAVGWRKDNRVYLIEHKVREAAMKLLDTNTAAALGGTYREQGRLSDYTQQLLTALDNKGWLVRKIEEEKFEINDIKKALWDIQAGTLTFKGVIIVDFPDDNSSILPQNTAYQLSVLRPHFRSEQKPEKETVKKTGVKPSNRATKTNNDSINISSDALAGMLTNNSESRKAEKPLSKLEIDDKEEIEDTVLSGVLSL